MAAGANDAAACVQEVLERIATGIGVEARVRLGEDADGVTAEFVGHDLGLLIGRHGQTIDSVQYLMNAIEQGSDLVRLRKQPAKVPR